MGRASKIRLSSFLEFLQNIHIQEHPQSPQSPQSQLFEPNKIKYFAMNRNGTWHGYSDHPIVYRPKNIWICVKIKHNQYPLNIVNTDILTLAYQQWYPNNTDKGWDACVLDVSTLDQLNKLIEFARIQESLKETTNTTDSTDSTNIIEEK